MFDVDYTRHNAFSFTNLFMIHCEKKFLHLVLIILKTSFPMFFICNFKDAFVCNGNISPSNNVFFSP